MIGPLAAQDSPSYSAGQLAIAPDETLVPLTDPVLAEISPERRFSLGLDTLVREDFLRLDNKRVLVVTNRAAVDSEGRHLLETLLRARRPQVTRVLIIDDELPQPARSSAMNKVLATRPDVRTFVRSERSLRPTESMMTDADVVVVDLALRGARFLPEFAFLGAVLEQASLAGLPVMILDRPDALTTDPEGPVGYESEYGSVESFLPTVAVPALTTAETAQLLNNAFGINVELRIVPILNWKRMDGYKPLAEAHRLAGANPAESLDDWVAYTDDATASLAAVAALLPDGMKPRLSPGTLEITVPKDAVRFVSELAPLQVPGLASSRAGDKVVRLTAQDNLPIMQAAIALWLAAIDQEPSLLPPEGESGPFGTPLIVAALHRDLKPEQVARAWANDPATIAALTQRKEALRYQ
ncbi:MAG: DUF1343 domain-containing protein [Sumerlaeia bacterium]